ncbi:GreA/GreB family elongation factor [Rhizobium leguminosarum]|uniref:GreA/GreB family elongation factor n=1 Tax=Rhizobium leguminosarum TaxID=384 RepID=UPI001C917410|nr:GreA/GreB family elongation factor [Rhizobium leguminosarum]MBY3025443.1 hypothetical protein [Rhizobium leguminosarum]
MRGWVGNRSSEFGVYPVELHFSLDSHVGPAWVVPALLNRSGWLAVAEVEMETDFDHTRAVVAACINDEGEVLGKWVAEALFSMQCALPMEVVTEPPDDLGDALDALHWDFLGGCDIAHLRALEDREQQTASSIARLESRRKDIYAKVEDFLSNLYARRRREWDRPDICRVIDEKIEEIENKQSAADAWHRSQLSAFHAELEEFETQVFASLQSHGRLRPLYTVYWQTRYSRLRTVANTGFDLRYGLPKRPDFKPNFRSAENSARRHRIEQLERKRKEFADYYDELDRAVEDTAAGKLAARIAAAEQEKRTGPAVSREEWAESFKTTDFFDLAAKSRAWEARHGRATATTARAPGRKEVSHPKAGSKDPLAKLRPPKTIALPSSGGNEQMSPAAVAAAEASLSAVEELDNSALVRELQVALERDADLERETTAITTAETLLVEAPVAQGLIDTPLSAHLTNVASFGVVVGDTVLLRFTDGGLGKFIRYTIGQSENDPSRGVLSVNDPRAQQMLGKEVGDEVALEQAPGRRTAAIESISREGRPVVQLANTAPPEKAVVEPGDTVVLRYFEEQRQRFYHCVVAPGLISANGFELSRKQERARALLGKQVGDEFTVWLGSFERPVRIDRILKP